MTPQTLPRHRNIKVHPDTILRHLVKRRRGAEVAPVHPRVRRAVAQHQAQRLRRLGVIRAARAAAAQGGGALRQVAAQETRAVARGVALLREPLAERGFGLHDYFLGAAVEEEVVVLGGESEVGARVQAEWARWPEIFAVVAGPHEWIGY